MLRTILDEIVSNNDHLFRWDIKGIVSAAGGVVELVVIAKKDFVIGDELYINSITGEISKGGDVWVGVVESEHPKKPYWVVNSALLPYKDKPPKKEAIKKSK